MFELSIVDTYQNISCIQQYKEDNINNDVLLAVNELKQQSIKIILTW